LSTKAIHIDRISREEWKSTWSNSTYATFYEHPDWFEAWKILYPGSEDPFAVKIVLENRITYIIPCFKRNLAKGIVSKYECGPGGLYAGPLGITGGLNQDQITSIKEILISVFTDFSFRINPFVISCELVDSKSNLFTQVIHLNNQAAVSEHLQQNGVTYDARSAQRKGLRIKNESDFNLNNFLQVYDAIRLSWENPGTYYPAEFFDCLTSSEHCDVWSVFHNDDYIGGGIILKGPSHVSSWLTIMHPDSRALRPYEFAYQQLIEHYTKAGFKYFDFNPSAGLDGVVKFKEKFGTEQVPFLQIENQGAISSLIYAIRGENS